MISKKKTTKAVSLKGKKVSSKPYTLRRKTTTKSAPAGEKKYKHPRNMPLVETLDRIEKGSVKRKTEQACYVNKDNGKCLFCVEGTKNSVTPNDKQIKYIEKYGKMLIVSHNHPRPYNSSITGEDICVAINNSLAGIRAVTNKYTFVARPSTKNGKNKYGGNNWGCTWLEAQEVYNKIFKQVESRYNKLYFANKMSKAYYEENLTHEVMEKVAKKLGFEYFRFLN